MADYVRAEPSLLTKPQISALAESFATHIGFEPCGSLHEMIARLGGKVEVKDTLLQDPEQSGSLFVDSPDSFTVIVPSHTSTVRDRFTIAHELGHFVIHYLWKRQRGWEHTKMMALRKDSDRVEWEANWFAAAFLMPSDAFRAKHQEYGGDMQKVASAFCVSLSAAEVRSRSLGL